MQKISLDQNEFRCPLQKINEVLIKSYMDFIITIRRDKLLPLHFLIQL